MLTYAKEFLNRPVVKTTAAILVGAAAIAAIATLAQSYWFQNKSNSNQPQFEMMFPESFVDITNTATQCLNTPISSLGNPSGSNSVYSNSFTTKVAKEQVETQNPEVTLTKIKDAKLLKAEQTTKYIKFIESLNPDVVADAKKILAWQSPFNQQEYEANKEKYIQKLCRKLSLYIHPDKCSTKDECQTAFIKMKQAAERLISTQALVHFEDFFKDLKNYFQDPILDDMPVYFTNQAVKENTSPSDLNPEELIKKSFDWTTHHLDGTITFLAYSERKPKHLIDWITSPGRQRFEFEYTPNGWNRKLNADFDFKSINQETITLSTDSLLAARYRMAKTQAYLSFPVKGKLESALLSIVDGNIVLWQRNSNGQETIAINILSRLDGHDLSAFNLFNDFGHIKLQENNLVIPLQMLD